MYHMIHTDVKCYLTIWIRVCYCRRMATPKRSVLTGNINLRGVSRDTLYRLKMAAAAEQRTVKALVLELIEGKIEELERKGLLPKVK